jgi:hypothetical protein
VLLTSAPVLIAPERLEPLLLYPAVTTHVVSTALVVEREEPGRSFNTKYTDC